VSSNSARTPNTVSLAALFGADIEAPPYAELSDVDLDRLVIKCRQALSSHRRDSLSSQVDTAETALAAISDIKMILTDILAIAPSSKRAKIAALIESA
jgi:hypothetical protein